MKESSLVDEGKRVKKIIDGECYYVYVPDKGEQVVAGPRENFPTPKHDRDILGVASKEESSLIMTPSFCIILKNADYTVSI